MKTKKKIVVVIPAYNCSKKIKGVFEGIPKDFLKKIFKFVIINDGSLDNTQKVLMGLKSKYKKIKIIRFEKNKGYAMSQKTGFTESLKSGADVVVLIHSDGQHPPQYLGKIVQPVLENKADVAIGSRILGGALKGGMPLWKYMGSRSLTFLENVAYAMNVSEFHTGFICYSRKALTAIPYMKLSNSFHFDGEMIMMSGKKKLRIKEIPIPTIYADEKSNVNMPKYVFDIFKMMFRNWIGKYDF